MGDSDIERAILEARRAGAFWKAARENPKSREFWLAEGVKHHKAASRLLTDATKGAPPLGDDG